MGQIRGKVWVNIGITIWEIYGNIYIYIWVNMGKYMSKMELEMGTSSIKLSIAAITRGSAAKNDVGFCGDLNGNSTEYN